MLQEKEAAAIQQLKVLSVQLAAGAREKGESIVKLASEIYDYLVGPSPEVE
jgi:hypothetical protein